MAIAPITTAITSCIRRRSSWARRGATARRNMTASGSAVTEWAVGGIVGRREGAACLQPYRPAGILSRAEGGATMLTAEGCRQRRLRFWERLRPRPEGDHVRL